MTKALADFDYAPSTPLEDGLRRFVEWYQTQFVPDLADRCPGL